MQNIEKINIILGFGLTETEQREKIYQKIKDIVYDAVKNNPNTFITGGFNNYSYSDKAIKEIRTKVGELGEQLKNQADTFEANNYEKAPERYTYFWHDICSDCCNVVVGIKFEHVNTKYPMSPDGIACFEYKDCFWFSIFDVVDSIKTTTVLSKRKEQNET